MTVPANFLTATETIELVRQGKLTVEQVAQDHIRRYEERDDIVHAWAYFDKERIINEARRLDGIPKEERGPLHGVILGIKDMMNTRDLPTQHNSMSYVGHQPGEDATAIAILRQAGALIYAKAHTTEFAISSVGPPTTNPYDPERTPGGSSSGPAAAVRDFQCHVSLGTQTGGSMIRPAGFNGVFALKPTWGAISREGLKTVSLILDTLGVFARSITDLELFAKVLNLRDDVPPPTTPKPLNQSRFLYLKTQSWDTVPASPEVKDAWIKSQQLLREAGAEVVEGELGPEFDGIMGKGNRHDIIQTLDMTANLLAEHVIPANRENLHPDIIDSVVNRPGYTRKDFLKAYDSIAALRPKIDELASQYDAIVTPSTAGQAPEGLGWTGDTRFNGMWTVLHVPVVNIPGFASQDGMPVGLSLVAPRYEDQRLLSVAKAAAEVWIDAEREKLRSIPAPEGVRFLQP